MRMPVFEIRGQVIIRRPNLFGREASISLRRPDEGRGWFLRHGLDRQPIGSDLAFLRSRRIVLKTTDQELETYEHLGALRFAGLVGLDLGTLGSGPYFGSAEPILNQVKKEAVLVDRNLPFYSVNQVVRWQYPKARGGQKAFTEIRPAIPNNGKRKLILHIRVSYPGLGSLVRIFSLSGCHDDPTIGKILAAKTIGLPAWLRGPSYLASVCGIWPHHAQINWPGQFSASELLEQTVHHRAQDILGALSLLCGDGLFTGTVTSVCSGHEADLAAVKEAAKCLERVF